MDASFTLRPFEDDLAICLLANIPSSASLRRGEGSSSTSRRLEDTNFTAHSAFTARQMPYTPDDEASPLPRLQYRQGPEPLDRSPSAGSGDLPCDLSASTSTSPAFPCTLPLPLSWHDTCPSALPAIAPLPSSATTPPHPAPASAAPSSSSPHARTALLPLSLNVRRRYLRAHPHPQRDERERERSRTGGWVGRRTRRVDAEERDWGVEAGAFVHRLRLRF
ncbi:hypothetical protein DFH09DRAFT_1375479 [Mycena vulgaris]|nr:hypothetical protein DFH09DRAFT_1375479 [Mycena vulgaris]